MVNGQNGDFVVKFRVSTIGSYFGHNHGQNLGIMVKFHRKILGHSLLPWLFSNFGHSHSKNF